MKKIALILIVIFITSCKKTTIAPTQVEEPVVCETKSKIFEGKYIINNVNGDTVNIVFNKNYCPDNNSNSYYVYGLNKAIQPIVNHSLNTNHIFRFTSDESAKKATNDEVIGTKMILNSNTLTITLPNEGDFYFTKIN